MYINESLSKQDLVKLLHLAVPTGIPASSLAGNTWSIKHTAFIYIFVWNFKIHMASRPSQITTRGMVFHSSFNRTGNTIVISWNELQVIPDLS